MEKLNIAGRMVGPGEPPYIIAEIGANHNGDMKLAKKLIDTAKACGTDAVKFQSWSSSSLISATEYARNPGLKEAIERYQLTPEQHRELAAYCRKKSITFLSSCFSPEEVELLVSLDVPAIKIASMDVNHTTLLEYVAGKKKPVILATGMATFDEIKRAVGILKGGGAKVALLHCVSVYPPDYETMNLRNMATLQQAFDMPVGFSDHTIGISIPLAAIALGACIIEKHFTLDKKMEGWDHAVSANPDELKIIVQEGRNVFASLGSTTRTVSDAELDKRAVMRRSIVAKHALKKGKKLSLADIDFKRPGKGIPPDEIDHVIGRSLTRDISPDEPLQRSDLT